MSTIPIVIGVLMLSAAIVLAYKPYIPAAVVAYAALWLLRQGGLVALSQGAMLYWGIATLLVILLDMLRRDNHLTAGRGQAYLCTGIIAGLTVGLLLSAQTGCIIGAATGALLGAMAYRRTPGGRQFGDNYARDMIARAFPALVAICQTGPVLQSIIVKYSS